MCFDLGGGAVDYGDVVIGSAYEGLSMLLWLVTLGGKEGPW